MRKSILSELESRMSFMSRTERKLTDVIFSDIKGFTEMSMAEFAVLAGVSQGSVINFARKFSGGGFPTLKLRVAEELAAGEPSDSLKKGLPAVKKTLETMLEGATHAMRNTLAVNSDETLSRVADMIIAARKVELCGVYRSAVVATDFCYQLIQLGVSASFIGDVLTCVASASALDSDSLIIAVSLSGRTKDVIEAVKAAKENGVAVVSITCDKLSPLARLSDEVLISAKSGADDYSGENSEARLSQMLLVDALSAYIHDRLDASRKGRCGKIAKILNSHSVDEY